MKKLNRGLKNQNHMHRKTTVLIIGLIILGNILLIPSLLCALDPFIIKEAGPPVITQEGVLFTYQGGKDGPEKVMVSGDFNNWEKPLFMIKNWHNVFVYLYNKKGEKSIVLKEGIYHYRYLVDGVWKKDPMNPRVIYDKQGTALSFFEVKIPVIITDHNPTHIYRNRYIFYYKNDEAESVYLVGDFNYWNPYSLPMKKNKSGLWEVEVNILPGTYSYRFLVDGIYRNDPLGATLVTDRFDNEYSLISLPLQ